ncbi:MAG: LAGLIDADG family homing endonuclease [Candidatus Aenigmatarchaeota archaeon]
MKRIHKKDMITPELSEIVGAFIGDGFFNVYNKKHYIIEFTGHPLNDYDYYTQIIVPLMKYLFACKPHIQIRSRALRLRYYSKDIYLFFTKFLKLPAGKKSSIIKIPQIFLENKKNLTSVLRGIFDTDGSIIWDKRGIYKNPYPRLSITTKSKSLDAQLFRILKKMGFSPSLVRDNYKNNISYHVDIYSKKSLDKWIKEIGFSNLNHIRRLCPSSSAS